MGGNGIIWKVYVNGYLMNVGEYGIEKYVERKEQQEKEHLMVIFNKVFFFFMLMCSTWFLSYDNGGG